MSDSENRSTMDNLREELKSLRTQLEGMVKNVEEKRHELTADMAQKIAPGVFNLARNFLSVI